MSVGTTLLTIELFDFWGIVGNALSRVAISSSSVLPNRSSTESNITRFVNNVSILLTYAQHCNRAC